MAQVVDKVVYSEVFRRAFVDSKTLVSEAMALCDAIVRQDGEISRRCLVVMVDELRTRGLLSREASREINRLLEEDRGNSCLGPGRDGGTGRPGLRSDGS